MIDGEFHPCFLCGKKATERHHVFGGPNRSKSERYGLVVWLCRECHDSLHFGPEGRKKMDALRRVFQKRWEARNPGKSFLEEFGRNWRGEEDEDEVWEEVDLGKQQNFNLKKY